MEQVFVEDKTFDKVNFTEKGLKKGDYENCVFTFCDFSNVDLSYCIFSECVFNDCNLSLVKLIKTTFREVTFKDCKMLGLQFENCSEFGLRIKKAKFSFPGMLGLLDKYDIEFEN